MDDLFVGVTDEGCVSCSGFNEVYGSMHQLYVDDADLVPVKRVYLVGNAHGSILLSGAIHSFVQERTQSKEELPILYCSPALLGAVNWELGNQKTISVKEMMQIVWHLGKTMCITDPRNFRLLDPQSECYFRLLYHMLGDRLSACTTVVKNLEKVLAKHIKPEYSSFAYVLQHHAMAKEMKEKAYSPAVVDLCAAVIHPWMMTDYKGRFAYAALPSVFGFSTLDVAVSLGRMFADRYDKPLPYEQEKLLEMFCQLTGKPPNKSPGFSPIQILGLRVIHQVLTTPLDDLGMIPQVRGTRAARDVEIVTRFFHWVINEWMRSLLAKDDPHWGEEWVDDEYTPDLFTVKEQ